MKCRVFALFLLLSASQVHAHGEKRTIQGTTYQLEKNVLNKLDHIHKNLDDSDNQLPDACPVTPIPERFQLPVQNLNSPAVAFFPNPSENNDPIRPPQSLGVVFNAGDISFNPQFPGSPPDTSGTVGLHQWVTFDNTGIMTFDKRSGELDGVINTDLQEFFNLDGDFTYFISGVEPRIRYDAFTDRFFAVLLTVDQNGSGVNNGFSIAVSDSGVLTQDTKWSIVNIFNASEIPDIHGCPGDQDLKFHFPTLGIDKHALYIGINAINAKEEQSVGTTLFVVQKKSLLRKGPALVTVFREVTGFHFEQSPLRNENSALGLDNFDEDAKFGYFVMCDPYYFGKLDLFRVVDPGSDSPTLVGPISFDVPTTGYDRCKVNNCPSGADSFLAPFQGNLFSFLGALENGADDRITTGVIRNRQLYAAHNIVVGSDGVSGQTPPFGDRTAIRWYQIDLTGDKFGNGFLDEQASTLPALVQAGTLFDPNHLDPLFYLFPSIMVNKKHEMTLSGTLCNHNIPPSAFFTGRLPSDPLGILRIGASLDDIVYAYGSGSYHRFLGAESSRWFHLPNSGQRWGDYSASGLDPEDRSTIWTIQEIAQNGLEVTVVAELKSP